MKRCVYSLRLQLQGAMSPRGLFRNLPELNLQLVRLSYQGLARSLDVSGLDFGWPATVLVYLPTSTALTVEFRYQTKVWQSERASIPYRRLID